MCSAVTLAALVLTAPVFAQQAAPEGTHEGDLVEVGDALYEVKGGVLVPFDDEAEPEPEPAALPAATPAPKAAAALELSDVTVTASRADRRVEGAVVRTDVVDQEEILERGGQTLSEVLSQEAGLQVSTPLGTAQTVNLDGLGGKYVLILIDGRPVNGQVNNTVDLSRLPITAANVEKVEIVRGPMSALYGSEALGGVVNIITKRPAPGSSGQVLLSSALARAGWSQSALSGNISGSAGPIVAKLDVTSLLATASDRAQLTAPRSDLGVQRVVIEQPDGVLDTPWRRQLTAQGEATAFLGDAFEFTGGFLAASTEVETRVGAAAPVRDSSVSRQLQLTATLEGELAPEQTLRLDARIDRFTHRFAKLPDGAVGDQVRPFCKESANPLRFYDVTCPAPTQVRSDSQQDDMRLEAIYTGTLLKDAPIARELTLSTGLVLRQERAQRENGDGENTLPGAGVLRAGAAYGEVMWRPLHALSLSPGVRADVFSPAGDAPFDLVVGPKLSARADLPHGIGLRASYGRGFRRPSFPERFLRFDHSELGYVVEGNATLVPEKSHGLRTELLYEPMRKIHLGAELYLNLLENQIIEAGGDVVNPAGIPIFTYANVARSYTSGLNLRATLRQLHGFAVDVGYQYLLGAVDASACPADSAWRAYFCSPAQGARSLPFLPVHAGHLKVRYRVEHTFTTFFGHADYLSERQLTGGQAAPASLNVGVGLRHQIASHAELTFQVENLLDSYHPTFGPKPGLNAQLTARAWY